MSLPAILAAAVTDDTSLCAEIGEDWLQGRTAFGGVSTAIALTAAKAAFPDLPPLRSAQMAFVGPLAGAVRVTPTLLRRGRNSAFVACDVTSGDGVGLRALFLFMSSRESAITHEQLAAPPHEEPDGHIIDRTKLPQGFLQNFDLANWLPEWGRDAAGFLRWARLRDRASLDPEVEFVTIADALPPAAMALAPQWGPISTTTWQINMVCDRPTTEDGWWLLQAETLHAKDGASSQTMAIWNRNGSAMATATQSVALFI